MCRAWAACAHTNTRCEQCSVNTWKISEQAEQKKNERNNIKSWLGSRNSKLEKAKILNMSFFPTLIIYVDNDNVLMLTKI